MIDLYGGSLEVFLIGDDNIPYSLHNVAMKLSTGVDRTSPEFVQFVSSASVKISLLQFTNIEVHLNPPLEQAKNLIESGKIGMGFSTKGIKGAAKSSGGLLGNSASSSLPGTNRIKLRMHYGGKSTPYYAGVLMPPDLSIGADGIQITLKAVGMMWNSTKKSTKTVATDMSNDKFLRSITDDGKLFNIKVNPGDKIALAALDKAGAVSHKQSDWKAVKTLLMKEGLHIVDIGSDKLSGVPTFEIVSSKYMRSHPKSQVTLVAFEQIDPNKGRLPILSMDTSLVNYMFGQTVGIQSSSVSSAKKTVGKDGHVGVKDISKRTDTVASSDSTTAASPADGTSARTYAMPMFRGVSDTVDSYKEKVVGFMQQATESAFRYEVVTVGALNLMPGRPVVISVAGIKFLSSTYDCYEVEHSFNDNGCETKVTLAQTLGLADLISNAMQKVEAAASADNGNTVKTSTTKGILPL